MSEVINHSDDEIDLSELIKVLWHRKWFIIVFVVLVTLLASVFIMKMPNQYQSSVLIMFKKTSKSNDAIQSLLNGSVTAAENTETELELIKSRRFAEKIVDALDLSTNPDFIGKAKQQNTLSQSQLNEVNRQRALNKVLANITVKQLSNTHLISISYQAKSPELAKLIANEVGNTFVTFKEELMAGDHRAGSEIISEKIKSVQASLDQAEYKIVAYQNEHDFIDIESAITFSNTKLTKLHAQKQDLDNKIEQSHILKRHITQSEKNVDALLAIPVLAKSAIVNASRQEIIKQQKIFDKIKLRYGSKHPKYREEQSLLEDIKSSLFSEIGKQVSQIDKQLQIYQDNLIYLKKGIDKHTLRLRQLGVIEFDFKKLKHDFDANLAMYESLVNKKNESDLMQDLTKTSNIILVEKAHINNSPVKPNRKLMLVLAVLGSLMLSVIIVFIEVMLGDKVIQLRRVAIKFNTKVIGIIPKIKIKKRHKDAVLTKIDKVKYSSFIESIRSIRTNILLDKVRSKQKVIAITSINPNDGKSSLSIQLAECFAELESVLLVDADLRYPSIAQALGEDPNRPGLTNLIAKSHSLEQATMMQEEADFDVIASGNVPKNPLVFLSNPRLKNIIMYLKSKYERVILECPPIMSVSDAFIISKHVDSVYLVIDAERTDSNMLANVLEELQQANVTVGGVLLNKVKETNNYYSNKYYSRQNPEPNKIILAG